MPQQKWISNAALELKTYEENKITEKWFAYWKYDKRKIDEESLQLYGSVQKAIEANLWIKKLCRTTIWEIFKHKSVKVKGKLNNMD